MQDVIRTLIPVFQEIACGVFADMFGKEARPAATWEVVPRLVNSRDSVVSLGHCNDRFQCVCSLGMMKDGLDRIFAGYEPEIQIDGLGEVANALCGQLSARMEFLEHFGVLEQAPPLFSMGGAMYPRAFGVIGHIDVEGADVLFGYAARDVTAPLPPRV